MKSTLSQHITRSSTVVAAVGYISRNKFECILGEPARHLKKTMGQATNFCVLCFVGTACVLHCKLFFKAFQHLLFRFVPLLVQVTSSFVWTSAAGSGQNCKGDRGQGE